MVASWKVVETAATCGHQSAARGRCGHSMIGKGRILLRRGSITTMAPPARASVMAGRLACKSWTCLSGETEEQRHGTGSEW
jgi:hypothetical protein